MSTGCHKDRTDRQKDFSAQLSKQKLFRMSTGCQKDRKTGQQRDRKAGRKTEILFSLVIKLKSNRMSERYSRKPCGQIKSPLLFLYFSISGYRAAGQPKIGVSLSRE